MTERSVAGLDRIINSEHLRGGEIEVARDLPWPVSTEGFPPMQSPRHAAGGHVAIVGGGPVGIFAAAAVGQLGMTATVIEAFHEGGGQCTAAYPRTRMDGVPGQPEITGAALVENLLRQCARYAPRLLFGRRVLSIEGATGRFDLGLSTGERVVASAVVLATGAGALMPARPPIAGVEALEGASLLYAVDEPERFYEQRLVVVGDGREALDWATFLAGIAASVTLVRSGAAGDDGEAGAAGEFGHLVGVGRIDVIAPATLRALDADGDRIRASVAGETGPIQCLQADAVLYLNGLRRDPGALAAWGVSTDDHGIVVDPLTMATGRPGIYAVGDVVTYPGKLGLILSGFAEASIAARAAGALLRIDVACPYRPSFEGRRPVSPVPITNPARQVPDWSGARVAP